MTAAVSVEPRRLPDNLTVTAVVCVYTEDRWDQILDALASLREQTRPPDDVLVVVDNNDVLLHRLRQEQVTAIPNRHTKGLSGGRNTALETAQSDLVAFLDDDARAAGDWLETLLAHMAPDVLGVGSQVIPVWAAGRPSWWPREFDWVVGCSHVGLPREMSVVRNPSGGAMILRRSLYAEAGPYRSDLGRIGSRLLGCEETEFCLRAAAAVGGHFLYEPATSIAHHVPRERATFRYFRRRCHGEGMSKAVVARCAPQAASSALATERSYLTRTLPRAVGRGLADVARRDASGLARAGAVVVGVVWAAAGYLRGRLVIDPSGAGR
jgi:GT2 family glycosyltransferase